VPGRWMDHQTRRLVDDQEVGVLVKDGEGQVLRLGNCRIGRWQEDLDLLPAADALSRPARSTLHQNMAPGEKSLDPGPAQLGEHRHQRPIEAFSARGGVKSKVSRANRWRERHQIFDFTCPLPRTMMSTTARSKKLVRV
jgi:hypothetical protein